MNKYQHPSTVTACASPSDVTGSTFNCTGDVNYGGTCELTCAAGYTGARTLTCDQHTANAATSTWDDDAACEGKYLFYVPQHLGENLFYRMGGMLHSSVYEVCNHITSVKLY